MKNNDDGFDVESYRKTLSKHLTEEIVKIIQSESKHFGDEFGHNVSIGLLKNLVATMLVNSLENPAVPKDMSREDATIASYRTMKGDIVAALADAFSHAMTRHSGKDTDYVCDIHPVAEPINKQAV